MLILFTRVSVFRLLANTIRQIKYLNVFILTDKNKNLKETWSTASLLAFVFTMCILCYINKPYYCLHDRCAYCVTLTSHTLFDITNCTVVNALQFDDYFCEKWLLTIANRIKTYIRYYLATLVT